jgi:hypothetical protein
MTTIDQTPFSRLEAEQRLLNPVFKGATHRPGRFGFRGDVALEFAPRLADEARPPKVKVDQVLTTAYETSTSIPFLAAYLRSFEYLKPLAEVLGESLAPEGRYFLFCSNIDLASKFRVPWGAATFYVFPIEEAGVYNEMLELLYIERNALKKLDTAGKLDAIADKAAGYSAAFPIITYADGLRVMGPVKNFGENRPV